MTKIAILIVIVLIVAAGVYTELQRSNNLEHTAKRLGLAFSSGLQPISADLSALEFDLLAQGNREIANRMSGKQQGDQIDIFDYSYDAMVAGEGYGAHPAADDPVSMERRNQTVIRVQSTMRFADFDVSPTRSHQRQVAARFGFAPLFFEEERAFSQAYHLLARDGVRCRMLFNPEVRAFLLNHPGLVVEGRGHDLLFYRFGQRLKAKELPVFLQEAQELTRLFERALTAAD
ncbi:hypothetical protein [Sedimenticola selenatireducens]|uniref:Uncharacterized protein n=2 Tax=Sedimenticola selenatireducens TaxID=191960 RepID=A0A2N6CX73_9GAMM|nr:hypothetical protein [Sedimenticola selenatireducens]PLX61883.1 MAG: hypothetical protein C0630_07625 [Sedimenticola selenatireducens]